MILFTADDLITTGYLFKPVELIKLGDLKVA